MEKIRQNKNNLQHYMVQIYESNIENKQKTLINKVINSINNQFLLNIETRES